MPETPDLSYDAYRRWLRCEGFAWLGGSAQRFVDLRHPKHGCYFKPLLDGKGRIRRQATRDGLIAWRAKIEAAKRQEAETRAMKARVAATLAPQALAPPRAALQGASAIRHLAEDLRIARTRADGVTEHDLALLGWTQAQLDTLIPLARETAYALEGGI